MMYPQMCWLVKLIDKFTASLEIDTTEPIFEQPCSASNNPLARRVVTT